MKKRKEVPLSIRMATVLTVKWSMDLTGDPSSELAVATSTLEELVDSDSKGELEFNK